MMMVPKQTQSHALRSFFPTTTRCFLTSAKAEQNSKWTIRPGSELSRMVVPSHGPTCCCEICIRPNDVHGRVGFSATTPLARSMKTSSIHYRGTAAPAATIRLFSSSVGAAAGSSNKYLKEPKEIDMNDKLRKGLSWRAKQRGWLELDWLIGTFAQKHLANLSEEECTLFEQILELDNPDLFQWLSAQAPAPANMLENKVYLMLAEYVNVEHPDIMRKMSKQNQNLV
ncbi:unnamed protein product [Amoebophrya sp. A25]|nr:unnamed protein product [Amoebophrya sp. A25]|eukprot:GSA25T00000967001.1